MKTSAIFLVAAAMMAGSAAYAQNTPAKPDAAPAAKQPAPAATLLLGDKAPELTVSKWVKGDPITGFEKGKFYVVEFWATWCGPCKVSIPHLTELQAEYKDKGVTFVGVSVWEDDQAKVEPFVKEMGDKMKYTVCADDVPAGTKANEGKMSKSWMKAANRNGIPTAFVVNGDGKIAWIGHPMQMEEPLAKIVAGKWDIAAEQAKAKKAAENEAKIRPLAKKFADARRAQDWDGALAALDELIAISPDQAKTFAGQKFEILLTGKKDYDKAYAFGNEIVGGACKDDPMSLNQIAWGIVDPEAKVEKQDLDLALKAATRADELTKGKDAAIIDTLALVTFKKGNIQKAIDLQTKAVEIAPDQMKEELEARLKEFKEAAKKGG